MVSVVQCHALKRHNFLQTCAQKHWKENAPSRSAYLAWKRLAQDRPIWEPLLKLLAHCVQEHLRWPLCEDNLIPALAKVCECIASTAGGWHHVTSSE